MTSASRSKGEDVAWQGIESGDRAADCIIVTDGDATTALAFYEAGIWRFGRRSHAAREYLDFAPLFWMPLHAPNNPLRAAFPDGRPPMWPRSGGAHLTDQEGQNR